MGDPCNLFTVDLEEWFHVCGVGGSLAPENWDRLPARVEPTTHALLEMLDRRHVRAAFFVVGWVAERYPDLIEAVRAAGHDIGSHGYHHERAYDLGPHAFRDDFRRSVRALAAAGIDRVTIFRAPEWSINGRSLWALEALVEEGVEIDASMAPIGLVGDPRYPRYPHIRQTAAGPITEVPPLVTDWIGLVRPMGWGWGLRMSSPLRVLRTIDAVNRAGIAAALTVHPWELDPDPPRVRLPASLQFAHYFRLRGFAKRLDHVLRSATFGRIGDTAAAASIS